MLSLTEVARELGFFQTTLRRVIGIIGSFSDLSFFSSSILMHFNRVVVNMVVKYEKETQEKRQSMSIVSFL